MSTPRPIVHHGDCLAILRTLPDESVDAVVTDPPYGLSNTDPKHVAETLTKWVTGDHEYTPSSPRKGRKNCLTELVRGQEGDAHDTHPEARKDLVHRGVALNSPLLAMLRAVNLDDHAAVGEVEVDHVSPALALDDVLVHDTLARLGQGGEDVEFRLRARQGVAGCVGECACFAELSTSVARVGVRLGYYAARYPEGAPPVVALRTTEVRAMLSFDARRGTVELAPAGPTDEVDLFTLLVTPKAVGAGTGTRNLPAVPQTNGVGGVDGAADGTFSLDLLAHETLLDRCFRPKDTPVGFMGKTWDSFVPPPAVWDECMRVLKPGGHLLVFAGTRTQDLMGLSIRLAGFDIRDGIGWIYGSGFPKSMDVSKAIDKARDDHPETRVVCRAIRAAMDAKGLRSKDLVEHFDDCHPRLIDHWAARDTDSQPSLPKWDQWETLRDVLDLAPEHDAEVWRLNGRKGTPGENWDKREITGKHEEWTDRTNYAITSSDGLRRDNPATPEAERWAGWGTALKPAIEPVIVARKPIRGTVAANVLAHGTGGINVDACRVGEGGQLQWSKPRDMGYYGGSDVEGSEATTNTKGRFPPNVLLDPEAAAAMDEQSGYQRDGVAVNRNRKDNGANYNASSYRITKTTREDQTYGGGGGASRFFPVFKYQAKAPAKERPQYTAEDGRVVKHATVKPLELMRWLVRLVTPAGGVVLDPFAGSGTTGEAAMLEGFDSILIEGEAEHLPLIDVRIARSADETTAPAPTEAPEPEPTPPTLHDRIKACTSRTDLADLYDEVTATDPAAWTDEHTAAGTAHLATIERTTP